MDFEKYVTLAKNESTIGKLHTVLCKRRYQITASVWEKEEMPADWQMAIICPVYKKGDKL
jgi:hypothetical protein